MNVTKTESAVSRTVKIYMILIGLIIIAVLTIVFYYFYSKQKSSFIYSNAAPPMWEKPVHDTTAATGMRAFTDLVRFTPLYYSKGVIYDSDTILGWLTKEYPDIKSRHLRQMGLSQLPDSLEWKIVFCWGARFDDDLHKETPGLNYYVVPMLYNRNTKKLLDYFDVTQNYHHPRTTGDARNIWDEGHMWP